MSILDKSFLNELINYPPKLNTHDEYVQYLQTNLKYLLNPTKTQLLSHIIDYNNNCDITTFLFYKYEDKYIFIEIKTGTCSGCFDELRDKNTENLIDTYDSIINNALNKCYITTNLQEIEQYFKSKLDSESDYRHNIYLIYPERPY